MPITLTHASPKRDELIAQAIDLLGLEDKHAGQETHRAIMQIAQDYERDCAASTASPRIAEARNALRKVLQAAKAFEKALAKAGLLGEQTRAPEPYPKLGGATFNVFDNPDRRENQSEAEELAFLEQARKTHVETAELASLIEGRLARWPVNTGTLRLHGMTRGSPKKALVARAVRLFVQHRPTAVSETDGSDIYRFAGLVYEYATGKPPDEPGVGLLRHLRDAIQQHKQAGPP